jgi:dolichol-phosphate mannosyltransferase
MTGLGSEQLAEQSLARGWQVPAAEVLSRHDRTARYCVVVFVINEGEKVGRQLREMARYADRVDIIVADGGSTDGSLTADVLERGRVRTLLTKRGPGKLSAQMRMAFAFALLEGYEGVVVIDGNGKDGVEAIPRFLAALDDGYDHVQGSRFIAGGRAINTPIFRLVAVRAVHAPLVSLAARHRHTDTTNGFRAYSRRLLADERLQIFRDIFDTYELHYYLAISASRNGYRCVEAPVTRTYPARGKTPTKISPIRGNAAVLAILLRAVRRRYDPPGPSTG